MLHDFVMTDTAFSPLAHPFQHQLRDVADRTIPVFGIAAHQTGSSVVEEALREGADPLEYAAEYYQKPDSYFAHYVIGHNGEIIQIAGENERAPHIGFDPADRLAYLNGSWVTKLPAELVTRWKDLWPTVKSPAHLFPGPSPNNAYVGVEMLPIVDGCEWKPAAWLKAGKFTDHQHYALVELAIDIAARQKLSPGWHLGSRLVTHEEVNPFTRSTKKPPAGWDPGWLRADPWFDMGWVRLQINDRFAVSS